MSTTLSWWENPLPYVPFPNPTPQAPRPRFLFFRTFFASSRAAMLILSDSLTSSIDLSKNPPNQSENFPPIVLPFLLHWDKNQINIPAGLFPPRIFSFCFPLPVSFLALVKMAPPPVFATIFQTQCPPQPTPPPTFYMPSAAPPIHLWSRTL